MFLLYIAGFSGGQSWMTSRGLNGYIHGVTAKQLGLSAFPMVGFPFDDIPTADGVLRSDTHYIYFNCIHAWLH